MLERDTERAAGAVPSRITDPTGWPSYPWAPVVVRGSENWSGVCRQAYVPLSTVAGPGFRGVMHAVDIGEANVSQVGSSAGAIHRDRAQVRSEPRDAVVLSVFLRTGGTILQGAGPIFVPAGGGYLLDSDHPYGVRFDHEYDMLALRLPAAAVNVTRDAVRSVTGRRLPAALPELGVLRHRLALTLMAAAPAKPDEHLLLAELVNVLVQRLRAPERVPARSSHDALMARALWFMACHHSDVSLQVTDVALELGVSRRHLEKLFETEATTPGAHLRELRLRRASQLLAQNAGTTVAAAAARSGFGDVNTFIRAFRRRWGTTPREWRYASRATGRRSAAPAIAPLSDLRRIAWTAPLPSRGPASAGE